MIYLMFGLVIGVCYWGLWQPQRAFGRGARRWAIVLIAFAYVSLTILGALGENKSTFALLFIAFPLLYSVLLRGVVRRFVSGLTRSRMGHWVVVFGLVWFSEVFAALDIASYDPVGRHMIVYIGFYIGLAVVIIHFQSRWHFSFPALFTLGGLWGLLVERQFAGSKMLLAGDLSSFLVFASIVFGVYGFYLAGPRLLFHEEWSVNPPASRWQHLLLFVAVTVVPMVTWALWVLLLAAFGFDTTVYVV